MINSDIFKKEIKIAVECEICSENPLEGGEDEVLSCRHIVHAKCIRDYLTHETKVNRKLSIPCLKCQKDKNPNPHIKDIDFNRLAWWLEDDRDKIRI